MKEKIEVIRGYGLNASRAELIATRNITKGDVVAVFALQDSNAVDVKEVHEFQGLVDATNDDPCVSRTVLET